MRLFSSKAGQVRAIFIEACAALAIAVLIGGCGDNYRPVVTPVNTSGPAAQPTSYAIVVSAPSPTTPGVVTIIDYSGDAIMTETPIGPGPRVFTVDELGATGYTLNSDGTLSNFAITTTLQQKDIAESTLPTTAQVVNLFTPASGMWATDLNGNVVDSFKGSPQAFDLAIPVATAGSPATLPVFIAGSPLLNGQRDFVLSQDLADTPAGAITCNVSPRTVLTTGVVTPIEITSNTADPAIKVGKCPAYAVETPDLQRLFVLNRGDDTISVINAVENAPDACTPFVNQNGQTVNCHPTLPLSTAALTATNAPPNCIIATNPTCGMGSIAGPVEAEYNAATQQLVVANYDGGSISVIDVSLDEYGNDSPTFGTTYTIPVGNTATPQPASVTVLNDGSKAYTANQNDGTGNGTVTVVNLSTHTVEKTLTIVGHPRTVVSTQNSEYSKVYVASPDSPYITIIQSTPTVTDLIDTAVLVEGHVVDVRTTTQDGVKNNDNYSSRVPGYGQPCNLPPSLLPAGYTLANCQAQP
jgi:DNA-binding beta-propeller fold protein YncE